MAVAVSCPPVADAACRRSACLPACAARPALLGSHHLIAFLLSSLPPGCLPSGCLPSGCLPPGCLQVQEKEDTFKQTKIDALFGAAKVRGVLLLLLLPPLLLLVLVLLLCLLRVQAACCLGRPRCGECCCCCCWCSEVEPVCKTKLEEAAVRCSPAARAAGGCRTSASYWCPPRPCSRVSHPCRPSPGGMCPLTTPTAASSRVRVKGRGR